MATDDIMALHTVRSNLPLEHCKSTYTLWNKIRRIDPGGIGDEWVLSQTNWDSENSEIPYYWKDPVNVMEVLLQNSYGLRPREGLGYNRELYIIDQLGTE